MTSDYRLSHARIHSEAAIRHRIGRLRGIRGTMNRKTAAIGDTLMEGRCLTSAARSPR